MRLFGLLLPDVEHSSWLRIIKELVKDNHQDKIKTRIDRIFWRCVLGEKCSLIFLTWSEEQIIQKWWRLSGKRIDDGNSLPSKSILKIFLEKQPAVMFCCNWQYNCIQIGIWWSTVRSNAVWKANQVESATRKLSAHSNTVCRTCELFRLSLHQGLGIVLLKSERVELLRYL